MHYFLVNGGVPVVAFNLELVKLTYRTDNVIHIYKEIFDFAECEYYIYLSKVSKKINEKKKKIIK